MKNFVRPVCFALTLCLLPSLSGCSHEPILIESATSSLPAMTLQGVSQLLSQLPIGLEQMEEVRDAVNSSSGNGYDEEYMMADLFNSPGSGVGATDATRATRYSRPLRDLIRDRLYSIAATRSGSAGRQDVEDFISAVCASGMQIYWPYSDSWDGTSLPVITFDPESEASVNYGYELAEGEDGVPEVREIIVDEELARSRPVWVVNANDDSGYVSLEQLRRRDPDWGKGGRIIVSTKVADNAVTRATADFKTLVLKDFTMNYHYENWFRGASEFWVKCGAAQGFNASTEAELKLYTPSVTDFMISVKRNQVGIPQCFNAVLISDWTDQMEDFAFMIVEDDGGTRTSWKVDTTVKIKSKSYGITVDLPFNDHDDLVWRGRLTGRYFSRYSGETSHFGGVDLTFELK